MASPDTPRNTFTENQQVASSVTEIVDSACQQLFEAYGLPLTPLRGADRVPGALVLCGVMGFVGSGLRGACLLAGTREPFDKSRPSEGSPRDWVGELTNQLMGRVKLKLLKRGTEIVLTTPIVLQGEHIAPLPRKHLVPSIFAAPVGHVLVWLDLETKEGFQLAPESEGELEPAEGDALFF
jgi:hypothetical protein